MELTLLLVLYALVAAGVAVVVRFYDVPVTEFKGKIGVIVKTLIGALIAVCITMWLMADQTPDVDFYTAFNFVLIVGAGLGGMATFRALIEKVAPGKL